jgi:hypothetical protein
VICFMAGRCRGIVTLDEKMKDESDEFALRYPSNVISRR